MAHEGALAMDTNDSEGDSEQRSEDKSEQPQKRSIWENVQATIDAAIPPTQRRFAEAAVLSLYFWHEAHADWPDSHGGALFYGAVGTCVVLLIELPFKVWWRVSAGIGIICLLIFIIVGPAPLIPEAHQLPHAAPAMPVPPVAGAQPRTFEGGPGIPFEDGEVHGVLKPANEPTPPNGCDGRPIGADSLKILIGDNAITRTGMGSAVPIGIRDCEPLSMERRPDGVFVNASLFDRENGAVITIRDNKINALNGANYTARQSRDESRLTIKNSKGTELFYVRFLNPTTIQFRGFLGCSANETILVRENQPVPGFIMGGNCFGNAGRVIQIGPQTKKIP